MIVRGGHAMPPRGSTEVREGDELHILVRQELRDEVEALTRRWQDGPIGEPAPPLMPPRGAPQVFSVGPAGQVDDPCAPTGSPASRWWRSSAAAATAPAPSPTSPTAATRSTSEEVVAIGGRQALARWCERRAERSGTDPAERAWWQELIGALIARG